MGGTFKISKHSMTIASFISALLTRVARPLRGLATRGQRALRARWRGHITYCNMTTSLSTMHLLHHIGRLNVSMQIHSSPRPQSILSFSTTQFPFNPHLSLRITDYSPHCTNYIISSINPSDSSHGNSLSSRSVITQTSLELHSTASPRI